jgi:catechol 2,3-dioxygenase-like lactoylglutathione lyase family enzyme
MALQAGGLHHLAIRVTDLDRAVRFYTETLGFERVLDADGVVLVNAAGTFIGIRGDAAETAAGDRFNPHRVGLDHLALTVADPAALTALKRQLDAAQVANHGLEDDPLLGARYISFYDPDGIAWELYAMPTA